jgi:hypothetical protein
METEVTLLGESLKAQNRSCTGSTDSPNGTQVAIPHSVSVD